MSTISQCYDRQPNFSKKQHPYTTVKVQKCQARAYWICIVHLNYSIISDVAIKRYVYTVHCTVHVLRAAIPTDLIDLLR